MRPFLGRSGGSLCRGPHILAGTANYYYYYYCYTTQKMHAHSHAPSLCFRCGDRCRTAPNASIIAMQFSLYHQGHDREEASRLVTIVTP